MVVFLVLIIRVKPKKTRQPSYQDRKVAENLMRRMHEQTETKLILEQLKDRDYRAQAWRIYASDKRNSHSLRLNESLLVKEPDVLRGIEKRIENIDRHNDFILLNEPQISELIVCVLIN